MAKDLVQITGFRELEAQLKKLPDKMKKAELLKILGQVANPTVKAMKAAAPQSKKPHIQKSKNRNFGTIITPGNLKKSIGKIRGKKGLGRKNPVLYVGPRSKGTKNDGWYGKFVQFGTVNQEANPFGDKAYNQTKGQVTADAEAKVTKYLQKQINRLSNK